MAVQRIEIHKYLYRFGCVNNIDSGAVFLYDAANRIVATMGFTGVKDREELRVDNAGDSWRIGMNRSALPMVVDMLRNEKPVFLAVGDGNAYLTTETETIGEAER